jgi:nitrite reductase (NADH) small subunit
MTKHSREYTIASTAEIPEGTHRTVELGRRKIGVFNIRGQFYALPNLCPHQLGPLCNGKVSGTLVANCETDWKIQYNQEGEIVRFGCATTRYG